MNKGVKSAAAVVFVAAVGVVLALPIIRSYEGLPAVAHKKGPKPVHTGVPFPSATPTPSPPSKPSPSPTPSTAPSPSPSPAATGDFVVIEGPFRELELEADYPSECLEHVARPSGDGLVATFGGELTAAGGDGTVTISTLGGAEQGSFHASAPVRWSPDGRYLATNDGRIVTPAGKQAGSFEGDWSWSPAADCVIASGNDKPELTVTTASGEKTRLLARSPSGFSISPDGTRMALTLAHGPDANDVWIANLETGVVREVDRAASQGSFARLGPWTTDGAAVYYWRSDSILRSVTTATPAERTIYAPTSNTASSRMPVDDDSLIECAGDPVGVIGSRPGPIAAKNRRLAVLKPNAPPDVLTPSHGFVYAYPQCSPDGFYIAAVRGPARAGGTDRHVVVLDHQGGIVQSLTSGSGDDFNPEWGPAGTGLLFVQQSAPGEGEVWFAAEGHSASGTGISLSDSYAPFTRKYGFESLIDWSATRPTGRPVV